MEGLPRLSSFSGAWLHAIRTRQVYNARLSSSHSRETLVVITDIGPGDLKDWPKGKKRRYGMPIYTGVYVPDRIALYSMRDNSYSLLPTIPDPCELKFPRHSQCVVALDGKIYILGGEMETNSVNASSDVYVLDLAGGQSQWKECASMKERRSHFGCGVMHGKIYVFGGTSSCGPVHGSEVCDPEANSWSPIRPMKGLRFNSFVEIVREELWVHSRRLFDRAHLPQGGTEGELILKTTFTYVVQTFWKSISQSRMNGELWKVIFATGCFWQEENSASWNSGIQGVPFIYFDYDGNYICIREFRCLFLGQSTRLESNHIGYCRCG